MPIIDLNKVNEECRKINDKFNFDEVMEIIRNLSIIASIKHKDILKHQLNNMEKK
jgi:hypothetical protein